jgi:release factor H-coupled RctB family protein
LKQETPEVRLIASQNNWIEGAAVKQLENTATWPGMRLVVGMPDLHPGKGSPIGAAFAVEGWLYPTLVGNDIGCGIGLWRTELSARKLKLEAWADRLRNLDNPWDGDAREFLAARGIETSGYEHCLGTIGGGNHFAELQAIESIPNAEGCELLGIAGDAVYLCVHSGSRAFGERILREHVAQAGADGLAIGSEPATRYFERHEHARHWAAANRELIAARMFERLGTRGVRIIDICHNSVERRDVGGRRCWIHRKGAAPSAEGAVVIPGSRGAHTYLVLPKEPGERSAFSLPHGAGRKWSRSDSRARLEKRFSAQDLTRTELGSHVICEDKELLYEEAPQAYKKIATVVGDLVNAGLADVLAILKPLVTYKVRR